MIPSVLSLLGFAAGGDAPEPASVKRHYGGPQKKTVTLYPKINKRKRSDLDEAFDLSVREMYGDLTEKNVPQEIRKEAAEIVRPSAGKAAKQTIPQAEKIDWEAIKNNINAVNELMRLWKELQDNDEEDELLYYLM